jgi:hypothetical protein
MSAKRIQLADGTWQALDLFSRDSTKTFQERADESFADLLAKPGSAGHELPVADCLALCTLRRLGLSGKLI